MIKGAMKTYIAAMDESEKAYITAAWKALDVHSYDVDLANDTFERQVRHGWWNRNRKARTARTAALRAAETDYQTAMEQARNAWHTAHENASKEL